jgi:hypothetical protein
MISIREIERQYRFLNEAQLSILLEIHNLVAEISPSATVELRHGGIVYYHADKGGPVSAGICQALVKPDHIRLAFIHGALLPDPDHLLEGKTFPKRYVRITDFNQAPWEALKALIKAHSEFDPLHSDNSPG